MPDSESSPSTNSLFLHAAAVAVSGGALLILGHSGAGKSTLCQLLAQEFPTLADDLVRLAQGNQGSGTWHVANGKHPLATGCNAAPLRGIVRVIQGQTPHLIRATSSETCRYLIDAVFEIEAQQWVKAEQKRAWFGLVADIARHHAGWRLISTKDPEMVQTIQERVHL